MTAQTITPIIYQFKNTEVRTTTKGNEVWFCLLDICQILAIKNHNDAKSRLNPKGVGKTDTLTDGGQQELLFINESNLYKLIFRSNKAEARAFEDWVTGEVLPAIRKTGSYSAKPQLDTPSTKEDRKPLTNLVSTLVDCAPFSFRNAWHMVHAHMGGKHAEEFTLAELPIAMAFVQEQINLHTANEIMPDRPDIITEQAMKGVKAFIARISIEEPTQDAKVKLVNKQYRATVFISEEKPPSECSMNIEYMLSQHHKK